MPSSGWFQNKKINSFIVFHKLTAFLPWELIYFYFISLSPDLHALLRDLFLDSWRSSRPSSSLGSSLLSQGWVWVQLGVLHGKRLILASISVNNQGVARPYFFLQDWHLERNWYLIEIFISTDCRTKIWLMSLHPIRILSLYWMNQILLRIQTLITTNTQSN